MLSLLKWVEKNNKTKYNTFNSVFCKCKCGPHPGVLDTHSIDDLPPKLGKNIKVDLVNSRVVSNNEIMEKTREIYRNTEHEIKIIKPMLSEYDIIEANALMSRKISFSYIVKDRVQLEYKIRQLLRDIGWEKKASDETLKRKMSEKIPICLIFNEENGIVCFPDDRGKADLTSGCTAQTKSLLNGARNILNMLKTSRRILNKTKFQRCLPPYITKMQGTFFP